MRDGAISNLNSKPCAVADGLIRQIHRQRVAFFFFGALEEFVDVRVAERGGKNAVLEAIVVENVGVARRDDHAKAVIEDGPGSVLAAGAAAEIGARQQHRCAFVARQVQHEFRIRFFARQM